MGIYYPTQVEQVSDAPEVEISWNANSSGNSAHLLNKRWVTAKPLQHISNPACGDLRNQTYALHCTRFGIPAGIIATGIKLDIVGQRNGRIVDQTIQLIYQGNTIGDNNFIYITDEDGHLPVKNETSYGGQDNLWGAGITPEILTDPTFGVVVKFQSHPYYPHNAAMILDSVVLTVYE